MIEDILEMSEKVIENQEIFEEEKDLKGYTI
jgi:hypothetical protein